MKNSKYRRFYLRMIIGGGFLLAVLVSSIFHAFQSP